MKIDLSQTFELHCGKVQPKEAHLKQHDDVDDYDDNAMIHAMVMVVMMVMQTIVLLALAYVDGACMVLFLSWYSSLSLSLPMLTIINSPLHLNMLMVHGDVVCPTFHCFVFVYSLLCK